MALGKLKTVQYSAIKTPFRNEIGMVVRETKSESDKNVYLFYISESCQLRNGNIKYNCIYLRTFSSYEELAKRNKEPCWDNEIYIAADCRLPTIRIFKGVIYCELEPKNGRGKPIIASIYLKTGKLKQSRVLTKAKYITNCLKPRVISAKRHCSGKMHDFNVHTLVDRSGLSVLYRSASSKYIIEKINLRNLSPRSQMIIEDLGTSIRVLLICNKLYVIPVAPNQHELKITKAIDLKNPKNRQNFVIKMTVHFKNVFHNWIHYNPRLEEIFVGNPNRNSQTMKVLKCEYPFPISKTLDLSRIESTFLWSLVPSEHNHKSHMLSKLESYFKLIDPKQLDYISGMLIKCPPKTCHDSHSSDKVYCRMKSLITSLKIYSDYRQPKNTLTKPRKRLQVYFKLHKLLEQQKLTAISSKINSLQGNVKYNFLHLKKQINSFRSSIGTYFHSLAQFDQSTANSDMNLIYSLLGGFQKKSEKLSKTVQHNIRVISKVAFTSNALDIAALATKVAIAATAFLNPFDMIADASGNILELSDRIDDLTSALKKLTKLIKLVGHFEKLGKLMGSLGKQIEKNRNKYTAIRDMVAAAKKHAITDKAINKIKDKFLKQYDDYQPYYSKSSITELGALLEGLTDDLCEILFSGETSNSNFVQLGFAAKGDCFKTKLDVKYLIALYEDMYDHQESLIDAFASVVRATVAKHNAKKIKTIANKVTLNQIRMNLFNLQLYSLEMFVNSEIHKMIIVHDACNLLEYKNGAKMPHFCKRAIENPRGFIYDQLIASRFERDMCADDEISHHVRIPAMEYPLNKRLPVGVIDLNALYSGKMTYFQVPSKAWLINNNWVKRNDANEKLVLKNIQLYLPFLQKGKSDSPVYVHVSFKMAGDNRMVPKGGSYDFDIPLEYDFRYKQNDDSCANTLEKYIPYMVRGCRDQYKPPPICITSAGTRKNSVVYPSVFSKWEVQAFVKGDLTRPRPENVFNLRADVTLCVVRHGAIMTQRIKRSETGSQFNFTMYRGPSVRKTINGLGFDNETSGFDNETSDNDFGDEGIKRRPTSDDGINDDSDLGDEAIPKRSTSDGSFDNAVNTVFLRARRASGRKCCFDSKQIYDFDSRSCRSCPKGSKPNLYGYYCEKTIG